MVHLPPTVINLKLKLSDPPSAFFFFPPSHLSRVLPVHIKETDMQPLACMQHLRTSSY